MKSSHTCSDPLRRRPGKWAKCSRGCKRCPKRAPRHPSDALRRLENAGTFLEHNAQRDMARRRDGGMTQRRTRAAAVDSHANPSIRLKPSLSEVVGHLNAQERGRTERRGVPWMNSPTRKEVRESVRELRISPRSRSLLPPNNERTSERGFCILTLQHSAVTL